MPPPRVLIPANRVREIFGNISEMTLWRWLAAEDMNFPRPIVISRRRYWREDEIEEWIAAREAIHG